MRVEHERTVFASRPLLDPGVRAIDPALAEVDVVAGALARAFAENPVATWCIPDRERRETRLERFFALLLNRVYLPLAATYTAEGLPGGALWAPPGRWQLGPLAEIRLLPRLLAVCGRDLGRINRLISLLDAKHPSARHWYLFLIGGEPSRQGRGLGSATMRPVLERCDRDGIPAYLEASTPRNGALYERHGFRITDEVRLPKGGPPLWLMWREPEPLRTGTTGSEGRHRSRTPTTRGGS